MNDLVELMLRGHSAFYHQQTDGKVVDGFVWDGKKSWRFPAEEIARLTNYPAFYSKEPVDGTPLVRVHRHTR